MARNGTRVREDDRMLARIVNPVIRNEIPGTMDDGQGISHVWNMGSNKKEEASGKTRFRKAHRE
jgi:hypothetical protein